MKARKSWIGVGLVFILLMMIAWAVLSRSKEPRYQGKTVTDWLDVISEVRGARGRGGEGRAEAEAMRAIQAMGTNALPVLFRHLDWQPGQSGAGLAWKRVREALGPVGAKLPGGSKEVDPEVFERAHRRKGTAAAALLALGDHDGTGAARVFEWMSARAGSDTWPAVFAMREALLTDAKLREERISKLQDTNSALRRFAVETIAFAEEKMDAAFPIVTNLLFDADGTVRYWAVFATQATGRDQPEIVVPILANLLTNSSDQNQREAAVSKLADFGTNSVSAIPALEAAVADPDPNIARKVKGALNRIRKAAGLADRTAPR